MSTKSLILGDKVLFVKYEDLTNKKKTTLIKIFKFIQKLGMQTLNLDMVKLNKVIKSTEFKVMQELEKNQDFKEGVVDNNTKKRKTHTTNAQSDGKERRPMNPRNLKSQDKCAMHLWPWSTLQSQLLRVGNLCWRGQRL